MLSSAHILAMDTKNLFDVVDSIRARFPHVKYAPEAIPSEVLNKSVEAPTAGIYDNQAAIQEQLKIVEDSTVDSSFTSQKILSN